jgi:hypothetical protein
VPGLPLLAAGLLAGGAVMAIIGTLLVVLAVRSAMRRPTTGTPSGWVPPAPRGPVGPDASRVPSSGRPAPGPGR